MNIQGWNIIDVAREIFPQAQCETRENECFLTLQPNSLEIIKYTQNLNDIFRKHHANSASEKKLKSVFQKYQYKIIQFSELEQKISKTIEKLQRSLSPSSQNTTSQNSPSKKMEDFLTNLEALLQAGTLASQIAHNKDVILFIGTTGCGKSTALNYLAGCTMQKVNRTAIGLPTTATKKIILAQDPLSKIGHKNKSQTSYPKICDDAQNHFTYYDCPGISDITGADVEIYNAICIKEITEKAKSVKGILVFMEYRDFFTRGGNEAISKNLKYLQLLLKDFNKYQRAVLFLITKVTVPDDEVDLPGIKQQLLKQVGKLADSQVDLELAQFCQQIIASEILKDYLGEKVLICNPCGATAAQEKSKMLDIIREFSSFQSTTNKQDAFGYPLSQQAELHIEKTKAFLLSNVRSHLSKLEEATKTYWQKRSIPHSIENLKACWEEITGWLEELQTPTFAKIAQGTSYLQVSQTLTDHLKQCGIYWEKLKEIYPPTNEEEAKTYQLDVCLKEDLERFVIHLQSIQKNIVI
ncbi:GTPase domain-containing protein [Candidatus Protochlamydia amoebophila]|nr:GTPase domain-containing protein [Candidatus Protochlamydia amoebophila]